MTIKADDNLWTLCEERLKKAGLPHSPMDIERAYNKVYAWNKGDPKFKHSVGDSPDMIFTGEKLKLPERKEDWERLLATKHPERAAA